MATVAFHREYVDLLKGDILAALMLSQIVYWYLPGKTGHPKLRKKMNGMYWLVKSHQHWYDECGFSRPQTRRCLKVLKEAGLIETCCHKWEGVPTIYLRLVALKGAQGVPEPPTVQQLTGVVTPSDWIRVSTSLVVQDQCSYRENRQRSTPTSQSTEDGAISGQSTEAGETGEKEREEEGELGSVGRSSDFVLELETVSLAAIAGTDTGKISPCVAEAPSCMLGLHATAKKETVPMRAEDILKRARPTSPKGAIAACWKRAVHETEGGFQKDLTQKQVGQLALVQKALGDRTREVIEHTVQHWQKFASRAGAMAGEPAPTAPHVGFFLLHYDVAVGLLDSTIPSEPVVQSSAAVPPPTPPTPGYVMSDAEYAEMIAGLTKP